MHNLNVFVIVLVSLCSLLVAGEICDVSTLELVHVIFRHGDRTLDRVSTYPKDPYMNETYYPFGLGQLTNRGKQREYRLGKSLRRRYDDFLGDIYTPEILDAVSTNVNRTKASLELVLAGLFPPIFTSLEWERDLNWQPIPYNYLDDDPLLSFSLFTCPNYATLYEEYFRSPPGLEILQKNEKLYRYLSANTGLNITRPIDCFILYAGLATETDWGFQLPPWTRSVYPKYVENAVIDHYIAGSATTQLKQLSGGFLLKKIIADTQRKINNELTPRDRKLFLYSAHDYTIAYLLNTLEVFFPHIPPYGACIMIEVHRINGVPGIKVYYQDYTQAYPKLLIVPGCECFCPLERFVQLLGKNLPLDDNGCESSVPSDGSTTTTESFTPFEAPTTVKEEGIIKEYSKESEIVPTVIKHA